MISSHDGINFSRRFMEAFIRPGLEPLNWGGGHGNQTPAWGLIPLNDEEISVYWLEEYKYYLPSTDPPKLKRGTIRTDGFASVNAPYRGGECSTKLMTFMGSALVMNYSTSAVGYIKVEIQDENGDPLPGYELGNSEEIYGDDIERRVSWSGSFDLSPIEGQTIRLRFVMKDADLYSVRFR